MLSALLKYACERRKPTPYYWREAAYGRDVEVCYRYAESDPPVGAQGKVLTEEEHGIVRHRGYTTMTPNYPGLRGRHYYVKLKGAKTRIILPSQCFKPA